MRGDLIEQNAKIIHRKIRNRNHFRGNRIGLDTIPVEVKNPCVAAVALFNLSIKHNKVKSMDKYSLFKSKVLEKVEENGLGPPLS